MSAESKNFEPALDRAMEEIREEAIDPAVVEAAAARVWAKLNGAAQPQAVEHIRNCADFQALIPECKAGRLPEARALLVKDHVHECVVCRRVWEGKVVAFPGQAGPATKKPGLWSTRRELRWAVAAAVVVAVGLSGWTAADRFGLFDTSVPPAVQAVNGTLYRVAAGGLQPLGVGQELPDGVEIRTAKDSGAVVRLRDGSLVEMRERSGLATTHAGRDTTVRLAQGAIIVQAARRRRGHLYVATSDCRVAVTGTVFGVSAGIKGSRVSVVEGEVQVSQQSGDKALRAGDQLTTSTSVSAVRVQDDIAWSRNFEQHLALLKEVQAIEKGLGEVRMPDLRYGSRILDKLPGNVALFASIPNLGNYFAEAQTVFRQRLAESPQLRTWLDQHRELDLDTIVGRLRDASSYFGDEVVIVARLDEKGRLTSPVLVAEEKRPGFREFVRQWGGDLRVESRGGLMAFSPKAADAQELLDGLNGGFAATPLYARVAEAYRNGAGLLFAADTARMSKSPGAMQYLVGEQKQTASRTDIRAVVGFSGERQGIAAWLAPPAPMGALHYVSPEATFVTAFVVKTPAAIVDELVGLSSGSAARGREEIAKVQSELGFDIRNDLAASLGGEFALALDGPAFPVPAWRLVVETYDANRLQYSLGKLVEKANQEAAKRGKPAIRFEQETVNGRVYHTIASGDGNPLTEAHYTFADGYLVVAPSRALVDRALQVRANGVGIIRSTGFLALLPRDRYANCSAIVYQNLGSTLAPLAGLLGSLSGSLDPKSREAIGQIGNLKPMLIAAYGEPDRIEVAGTGEQFKLPLTALLTGNLSGIANGALPFGGRERRRPNLRKDF